MSARSSSKYIYNDLYETALKNMLGPLYQLAQYPANALLSRLLIILGYLHSDESTHIDVTLIPGRDKNTRPGQAPAHFTS